MRVAPLLALAAAARAFPTTLVYQSPAGLFLENLAVRPSGELLITSVYTPTLYSLDPRAKNASLTEVVTFPNASALTGIAEYAPDTYAVAAAVLDPATGGAVPGSVALWRVDCTCSPPQASLAARIPGSPLTNGLAAVPGLPHTVLAADSVLGAVYAVDMRAGAVSVLVQDALLAPPAADGALGANGLHVRGGFLYATNSARGTLLRAPLTLTPPHRGRPRPGAPQLAVGAFAVLGTRPAGADGFDDFALDDKGRAWVAVHPDALALFTPQRNGSWTQEVAAAGVFVQPTAAAFGRTKADAGVLYVTTVGGQVVAVDTLARARK